MLLFSNGLERNKNTLLYSLTCLVLFLYGAFMAVDTINYLSRTNITAVGLIKLMVSISCSISAWIIGRQCLDDQDKILLGLAFVFSFLGDIGIVTSTHFLQPPVSTTVFTFGGISFCVMHVFLILRHGKGFHFLFTAEGKLDWKQLIFPLFFYVPSGIVFSLFWKQLSEAGLLWIGLVYLFFVTTSLWVGWEPLRCKLFPPRNAWMIGIGMTSFFIMEAIGVIYNIKIGTASDIAFILTWFFYVPFLLLLPHSGYRWED